MNLSDIKGLKEKRIQKLNEAGIYSPEDLILYFPCRYFDPKATPQFIDGEEVIFEGIVAEPPKRHFIRKGLNLVKAKFALSNQTTVSATWFNRPYIFNSLELNKRMLVCGKVKKTKFAVEISAPTLYSLKGDESDMQIIPFYKPIKGLPQTTLIEAIKTVLNGIKINGYLTADICERFDLLPLDTAIRALHFPTDLNHVQAASQSVAIENLSYTVSVFKISRFLGFGQRAFFYDENFQRLAEFIKTLPFELTDDQKTTVDTIVREFHTASRSNRLIQGDVGCGKTVVAYLAMYYAALSGFQSVMMAPTEILARQHYLTALKIFENTDMKIEYLSGSLSKQVRDTSLFNIKNGAADLIIGTHSLISESVEFNKLSLVITDEQQRFGVSQRATLENKSTGADTLVMTATPIPRTLGLTFYGDLEQSVIKTRPKNRPKIFTHLVREAKIEDMYGYIKACAEKNMLTYIVCPRIEEDDEQLTSVKEMYGELKKRFDENMLGILHGQMKEREKIAVMQDFSEGKIKVLLSTTVVEVGIDVKDAVNIVIFDPDRYGLSQLHQLRGRVGRGTIDSHCFLVSTDLSPEAKKRLDYFVECNDGFSLAEYDLLIRGAGDFLGTRQHGQAMSLAGEKITPQLISRAKALSEYLLSYPNIKTEITKNIDENRIQYIRNLTLN